jgi:DNA topoisomerase-2
MTNKKTIDLLKYFSNELRDFFIFDCDRSIPSGIDGLKPSQRKIIYGIAKKYANQEIKVSLAAAGVAEISCYHHGSTSLEGAIIKMAQNFAGANNVPLLEPIGQFGSRIADDASAPRYIFTKISPNFRKLFREEDDDILKYLEESGGKILVQCSDHHLPNISGCHHPLL